MMSVKELFKVILDENKDFPIRTIHRTPMGILPKPVALSIVQYKNDQGFYLFYLNEAGQEQTDTYHETLDSAFEQAEFEFGISKEEWMQSPYVASVENNNQKVI
ncbi:hypothetical protein [Neisseria meningitidis]|uniref:hypothetical protein n=1 Tax=Neisseria meningitidis TaxID=487 RepID=UPI000FCBA842|nr:hypothetical protein [Neisseria meningitidis]